MLELDFLKHVPNHGEFSSKLELLGIPRDGILLSARQVTTSWFRLGEIHLREAAKLLDAGCERAVLSRAYYAVYNNSKAVRYLVNGTVSLKGDDHKKSIPITRRFSRWCQVGADHYAAL